jgi:hypothetical protein
MTRDIRQSNHGREATTSRWSTPTASSLHLWLRHRVFVVSASFQVTSQNYQASIAADPVGDTHEVKLLALGVAVAPPGGCSVWAIAK